MISKAKSRFIKQLQVKKYRQAEQCFLVQGGKSVAETLTSDFKVRTLLATQKFLNSLHPSILSKAGETIEVSESELTSIGSVEANNAALAVVGMQPVQKPDLKKRCTLVLDDIRDPGNLGTIIRTADWYGVKNIVATSQTTDVYSPKVINATMGSFLRVDVYYADIESLLKKNALPVYGAFLDGKDVHTIGFQKDCLIVIGNESHGISPDLEELITHRITIPRFGMAESLNASSATAIILDNFRRSIAK